MASSSNTLDMRGRSYADYRSSLAQRLMTFYPEGGGPSLWKCPYVHPDVLVRAGFIYSGQEDSVECVFCHENFCDWKPGDDPKMIHTEQRPDCEGIKNNWLVPLTVSTKDSSQNSGPRSRNQQKCTVRSNSTVPPSASSKQKSASHRQNNQQTRPPQFRCHKPVLPAATSNQEPPSHQQSAMAPNSNMVDMRGRSYADYQSNMSLRLMTFYSEVGGRSLWKCPHVFPDLLVGAGFIYSGQKDTVHCVFCRANFSGWGPYDDPKVMHMKRRPDCKGIKNNWLSPRTVATNDSSQNSGPRSSKEKNHTTQSQNHRVSSPALSNQESTSHRKSNQQIRTQSQNHNIVSPVERSHQESAPSRPVTHQHGASPLQNSTDQYTDLAVRIASFTGLWPHSTGKLTPKHMAVAGFYYAGDSSPEYADRVQCYICQVQLNAWEPNDDPVVEHKKFRPNCQIVKYYKHSQQPSHASPAMSPTSSPIMSPTSSPSNSIIPMAASQGELISYSAMEAEGPSTPAAFAESHVTLPKEEFSTKFPRLEELPSFLEHQTAALSALSRGAPNQDIEETTNISVTSSSQANSMVQAEGPSVSAASTESHGAQNDMEELLTSLQDEEFRTKFPRLQEFYSFLEHQAAALTSWGPGASNHDVEKTTNTKGKPSSEATGGDLSLDKLCSICMDKDKSIAFMPCGHVTCCEDCGNKVRTCPLCRKRIKNRIKIYL